MSDLTPITQLEQAMENYRLLAAWHGALLADHDRLKRAARDYMRIAQKRHRIRISEYADVRRELKCALGDQS